MEYTGDLKSPARKGLRVRVPPLALPTRKIEMQQKFTAANYEDENDMPAGGFVEGIGLKINWQDGPLGRGEDRLEPNGTFVETVIAAAKQRIEYYNSTQFRCRENSLAITKLDEALHWLQHRTADREARNVEGTHEA